MMERSLEDLSGEEAYVSQIEGLKQIIKEDEGRMIDFKKQAKKEIETYKQEISELRNEVKKKEGAIEGLNRIKDDQDDKLNELKIKRFEKPSRDLKEIVQRNLNEIEVMSYNKSSERILNNSKYMNTQELVNKHLKKRDNGWASPKKPEKNLRKKI